MKSSCKNCHSLKPLDLAVRKDFPKAKLEGQNKGALYVETTDGSLNPGVWAD